MSETGRVQPAPKVRYVCAGMHRPASTPRCKCMFGGMRCTNNVLVGSDYCGPCFAHPTPPKEKP